MATPKNWQARSCATALDPILKAAVRRGFHSIRLTNEGGLTRAEQQNGDPKWKRFYVINSVQFDAILSKVRWLAGSSLEQDKPLGDSIIEHAGVRFMVKIERVQFFQIAYLTLQPVQ